MLILQAKILHQPIDENDKMLSSNKIKKEPLCLLWFPDFSEPIETPFEITIKPFMKQMIRKSAKQLMLKTLISCPMPETHKNNVPTAVSIVGSRYEEPTNYLKVIYNTPR